MPSFCRLHVKSHRFATAGEAAPVITDEWGLPEELAIGCIKM